MMISYNELLEKYNYLLKENESLRAENKSLKEQLGIVEPVKVDAEYTPNNPSINKFSTPEEKIKLFRSLFKGREDVFARRWFSKTSGKSGYQPVCLNEWESGLCNKKQYKCSDCPNRRLATLTDKDVYNHLAGKDEYGRDVIGIYPMLENENCFLLVFDFDEENYTEDALAVYRTCYHDHFPAYIEISRSGNGIHLWMFFEEELSAADARRLGSILLTETMKEYSHLSFKSYDRMFPNQDRMPKGGFGNLIALPLQGKARKNGGSIFVNEELHEYGDFWAFLSSIQKVGKQQVEEFISTHKNEMGELMSASDEKPWESKEKAAISAMDCEGTLQIVLSNMLFVPRKQLSTNLQNAVKRLAAFKNPDFYKAQAMRLPVYNKPRVIFTADISEEYIALPRGCSEALYELLDHAGIVYSIIDNTNNGEEIDVSFSGELRQSQIPAANALNEQNIGVLSATTAFGKTVIAAYLIGEKRRNTLILVHTQALMKQWQKALEQFLQINSQAPEQKGRGRKKKWSPIGTIGGGKNRPSGLVDIAVMQSLVDGDEVKDIVRNYGVVIVDECHHVSAVNFEKILKFANAKYVYGLTATPTRQDGHHPIIFMQCGPIRYRVDAKTQADKRNFEHYIIPRFTKFRDLTIDGDTVTSGYKKLAEDNKRNDIILDDIKSALESGRTPLVLTERKEHVIFLAERMKENCAHVIILYGAPSQRERREQMEKLSAISDDEQLVIVATGKYVGEGFDYPRLDTLFVALPISWKGKVAQYAGRLHREYPGKTEVQIYDYIDINVPVFEKMYQRRLSGYAAIGYKVKMQPKTEESTDFIYNGRDYLEPFLADISNAQKEIVIVSSYIRKHKVQEMMRILTPKLLNGVHIVVVTKSITDYSDEKAKAFEELYQTIAGYGIKLIQKEKLTENFTVIDQRVSWYGNINFFAYPKEEQNAIRINHTEISGMLLDTISRVDDKMFKNK